MLISYSFSNFQSFKDRAEIDLTLSKKVSMTDWMTEAATGERVSKLMAVLGPNASGKTTLLKSLVFLLWFMTRSFELSTESQIPIVPYAFLDKEPSEFECLFELNGRLWRYELRCTVKRVLHEALYQKHERFKNVFLRDWDEATNSYIVKQQDFGLELQAVNKARQNVSFIAWAAQYNVPLAVELAKQFRASVSNINVAGREVLSMPVVMQAAEHFSLNSTQRNKMIELLTSWDLGLSNIELAEMKEFSPTQDAALIESKKKKWIPVGCHKGRQGEFRLLFEHESSFTRSAFVLLSKLLLALEKGGIALIDEIEADLHPHMLEPILGLFADKSTNPHDAQLLFTCHSIEILNLINKAQVTLVEKDEYCESKAIRLDNVQGIRNDDNLYGKYMAGAYGAVPKV